MGELPADVLLLVFRELQESTVGSLQRFTLSETDQRQASSRLWIPQITCVCRHWRETALATPLLWQDVHLGSLTTIRHGSSPEIKRSVELAQPLPIRIQVQSKNNIWRPSRFVNAGMDREWPRELSQVLEGHRSSISALHLLGLTYQEVQDLLRLTHIHPLILPVLSDLRITFFDYGETYSILHHSMMPKLMRLSLSHFRHWSSHGMYGMLALTHLSLSSQYHRSDLDEFLDSLELMPRLEVLSLAHAGPSIPDVPEGHALRAIPLRSLRVWKIIAKQECSLYLLYNTSLPANIAVIWVSSAVQFGRRGWHPPEVPPPPYAFPPQSIMQNATQMVLRAQDGDGPHVYRLSETTLSLNHNPYSSNPIPAILPQVLPNVRSLIVTWHHLFCWSLLETFETIVSFQCKVLAANERLFLAIERQESPMMPLLSELVLWIDPKSNWRIQLFSLRIFDESLVERITKAQVASRRRENGTSYDIKLVEGVIERYDDRDLETWS